MSDILYKIVGTRDWALAQAEGAVAWSAADRRDGYMHLSTAPQVLETARRHFAGRNDLVALVVDAARLSAPLRYEESTSRRQSFPHLYGVLPSDAVIGVRPLVFENGFAIFADGAAP